MLLYVYLSNSPTTRIDPSGLDDIGLAPWPVETPTESDPSEPVPAGPWRWIAPPYEGPDRGDLPPFYRTPGTEPSMEPTLCRPGELCLCTPVKLPKTTQDPHALPGVFGPVNPSPFLNPRKSTDDNTECVAAKLTALFMCSQVFKSECSFADTCDQLADTGMGWFLCANALTAVGRTCASGMEEIFGDLDDTEAINNADYCNTIYKAKGCL